MSVLPSLPALQTLASTIFNDVSYGVVTAWVNNPDASNSSVDANARYTDFVNFLNSKKNAAPSNAAILVALDDGTVMYDNGGTINGYVDKNINENHNTRPEILNAVLSASGTGYSRRYSSTKRAIRQYYAVRIGLSPQGNVATLRVALQE